jgi:hypothetical protein
MPHRNGVQDCDGSHYYQGKTMYSQENRVPQSVNHLLSLAGTSYWSASQEEAIRYDRQMLLRT